MHFIDSHSYVEAMEVESTGDSIVGNNLLCLLERGQADEPRWLRRRVKVFLDQRAG